MGAGMTLAGADGELCASNQLLCWYLSGQLVIPVCQKPVWSWFGSAHYC